MSWTVNVIENTLVTSKETAEKLSDFLESRDYYISTFPVGNKIGFEFDVDACEWIDCFASDPESIDILTSDPETNGKVGFADFEGDTSGSVWGYSFADGNMVKLQGRITWETVIT